MQTNKYRADIDGLRAIAIISVLIFHLDSAYLSGGFIGVDIFFVISGFLITTIIKNEIENTGNFSFKNFYIRRVRRLFPALIVVLIFSSILSTLILSSTHLSSFGASLTASLLSISNFTFWLEADYFDVSAKMKPLLHTWSLSVEEQFYFIWPITLLLLLNLNSKWKIISIMIFFSLISLYMNERFDDGSVRFINSYIPFLKEYISDGSSTIFFLLPFRIYEFMIGAILVWIVHYKIKFTFIYDILFILGIVFVGYAIFNFNDKMLFPSYIALMPTIGTALLIYSGNKSRLTILLSNKLMVGIGLISYSLYLIHWPIIVFWNYLYTKITIYDNLFILLVSINLAILSYKYIEQPFRTKKYDLEKVSIKYTSIFLVLTLGWGGHNMYSNHGWEWRIDSPVNFENMGDSKDFHKKFYGGVGYPTTGGIHTSKPADIVVIGDSHAKHYIEGLYKLLARPNNLSLYNSSGTSCISLPNFTRITKGSNWNISCPRALNKGLNYLKKGSKNSILIISESWVTQMTRADLMDKNGQKVNKKINVRDIIIGINKLKELIGNKKLIVIGNVPRAKVNLANVFSKPMPILFATSDLKKYITSTAQPRMYEFNNKLKEESLRTNKFLFLDPHDVLCGNNICRNIDNKNRLIYSDSAHLSKYGSIEVIKGFLPQIKEYMNAK